MDISTVWSEGLELLERHDDLCARLLWRKSISAVNHVIECASGNFSPDRTMNREL